MDDLELSDKEKHRRELILQREFANTTLSPELWLQTIGSLRDMPILPLIKTPLASNKTFAWKQHFYDTITNSSFYKEHGELVRAWFQIRWQDLMERGHLPSYMEIICIREVWGEEFSDGILAMCTGLLKQCDKEIREHAVLPKNEIETKVFMGLIHEIGYKRVKAGVLEKLRKAYMIS